MKKIGVLFSFIAMISFVLPVIGCQHSSSGSDDWLEDAEAISEKKQNSTNASVVSRWVNSSGNCKDIITLYDDGTYTYEKYDNDTLMDGQKGIYSSNNDETKLTVTQEWLEGNWSNVSGFGFYIKINGNTIEVFIWKTGENGAEEKNTESSSFTLDEESGNTGSGGSGSGSSSSETPIVADIPTIVAYIEALTEKGTYYFKAVDEETTSCSTLKTALFALNDSGIYVSLDLSESILKIGTNAFSHCRSLESVIIPSGVTTIGQYAFYYCSSLTSVTIPSSVNEIGQYAFESCSSLKSVTIPSSVTSIGGQAFYSCSSLESVIIPEGVTSIGGEAFYYCSSLASVTITSSITYISCNAFYKTSLTSADFKDTKGWTVTEWTVTEESDDTIYESIDENLLKDDTIAAEYLRSTYTWYYWTKN